MNKLCIFPARFSLLTLKDLPDNSTIWQGFEQKNLNL